MSITVRELCGFTKRAETIGDLINTPAPQQLVGQDALTPKVSLTDYAELAKSPITIPEAPVKPVVVHPSLQSPAKATKGFSGMAIGGIAGGVTLTAGLLALLAHRARKAKAQNKDSGERLGEQAVDPNTIIGLQQ